MDILLSEWIKIHTGFYIPYPSFPFNMLVPIVAFILAWLLAYILVIVIPWDWFRKVE